jgi:hypothetical protein
MSSKTSKGVVPRFLGTRKNVLRRSFLLDCGQGPPMIAGTFDNSNSLYVVDAETLQAEIIQTKATGEVHTLRFSSGYMALGQGSTVTVIFLGSGAKKNYIADEKSWFFFEKHNLVIINASKVQKIRLEPSLQHCAFSFDQIRR